MKRFNKNVVIGTKVVINNELHTVKEVYNNHTLIKVDGLSGSFQKGHITKYTNK